MNDDAQLLHGVELSIGSGKLFWIQAVSFGKNWRSRLGEKMVADRMARRRGCETIKGQKIWELKEQIGDALGSGEESCTERK